MVEVTRHTGRSVDGSPLGTPRGALLSTAALVVIVFGMQAAQTIVVPIFLACLFAIVAWPALQWLQRHGVPSWMALLLVVGGMMGAVTLVALLVGTSVNDFADRLPSYEARARQQLEAALQALEPGRLGLADSNLADYINPGAALGLVGGMLSGLGGALTQAALIFTIMIFLLLEGAEFPGKLKAAFGTLSDAPEHVDRFLSSVNRYVALKSVISLLTGLLVGVWVGVMGVPYAMLWGFVAFILNFVPNIGSILAAVPAVILALLELGPGRALIVALGYLVINVVAGNVVEPRVLGRGLGISPVVVLLSLVFWGWVLGPVGMLLSVPLTITIKLALATHQETRWIAVLLGSSDS